MGFTRGFSLGEEVGWRDGYQLGLQRGAQIATEVLSSLGLIWSSGAVIGAEFSSDLVLFSLAAKFCLRRFPIPCGS